MAYRYSLDLLDLLVRGGDCKHVVDIFFFLFLLLDHLYVRVLVLRAPHTFMLVLAAIQARVVVGCRHLLTCPILHLGLYLLFVVALGEIEGARGWRR